MIVELRPAVFVNVIDVVVVAPFSGATLPNSKPDGMARYLSEATLVHQWRTATPCSYETFNTIAAIGFISNTCGRSNTGYPEALSIGPEVNSVQDATVGLRPVKYDEQLPGTSVACAVRQLNRRQ